jgi:hypothetical protein
MQAIVNDGGKIERFANVRERLQKIIPRRGKLITKRAI